VSESRDPIDALPPLRTVIARHGLGARKSLGQHFLLDLNLTVRIARAAGNLGKGTVIEVGPGPGGLTRALLGAGAARVIAIERDPRCIEALAELRDAANGRLEIIAADARKIDIAALGDAPRRIVANLPYNVATPLLIDWLTKAEAFAGMTLMFQREVADRIVAHAGDPAYGRLSVIANWRCLTAKLLNLPARAFTPAPKVASAVIALTPYASPPFPADQAALEAVTAAAFGQRRKMLRGALKSLKTDPLALLKTADIDPTARAETVDIAGFSALARAYADTLSNPDAIP
jgi:16S rRNA (adenine1518-N6/adenine1519-N6)-dimethyltransferase